MYYRLTKWSVALSLILFVLMFTISSFSQVEQQSVANKADPIEAAQDLGELSLDELKARRASVEGSGDLAEPVKKNVLRFLDKSIRFREKEQQLARSLELLNAGNGLVAAMDHMLVTQESLLSSMEVIPALGIFVFRMEALREAGGETGALEEIEVVYNELHQMANETNLLALQERWTEVGVALEQEIRPANKRLGLLIEQLVGQADQDVEAMAAYTQMVIRQALLQQAVLVVLTTAIALGWRHFVFRGLSLSIGELRQGVERISIGDLDYKLDVQTGDEIEELADSMERMRISLKAAMERLKKQR